MAVLVLLALALPTGLVAIAEGLGQLPLPFNLFEVDQRLPIVFKVHMAASGAMLVLVPLVLALRRKPNLHRALGRITVGLVVLGALSSFPVAFASTSPDVARAGFVAQGVVWLALVVAAVAAARSKAYKRHAELMLAMTAVASGAIWVRLITATVAGSGLPFDPIYAAAAWCGWLIPLALVLAAMSRAGRRPSLRPQV